MPHAGFASRPSGCCTRNELAFCVGCTSSRGRSVSWLWGWFSAARTMSHTIDGMLRGTASESMGRAECSLDVAAGVLSTVMVTVGGLRMAALIGR